MSEDLLTEATAKVGLVRSPEGFLQTSQFLEVCRFVLPVVDKLGTAFALVKSDINGNIQRLTDKAATDPVRYSRLLAIVQDEVIAGTHGQSTSCTKGLLWLKRAMEFMVALLRALTTRPNDSMSTVVGDTYSSTLMQYHGFMVSSAFTLAFKWVPYREVFLESLGGGPGVEGRITAFVDAFSPLLAEVHAFLAEQGLDDPTKV
mmetsp:Transcript_34819/g.88233  ORF Transcript_34819/g.88233 Transcript_34819/m.88233 type:complete len:203 (-) Transcript_34819:477-1085(-)|eukprot:CAMPEP_0202866274 /NCGR_PEP_ID=MMETSP1391-20130828/7295_1 /ASSEMBLY_ACC=CAM_ASM_000867 /TAXON_ID=1034604 /ORGANISM="Chlamydomonas leiostraca, Strain SAG 11-49" /LENGTH=202 /DNA_ID=CAMNT_0049546207 /DNA_START=38 /DNA_END=646 /DNA_ORIENTATION=+